MKRIVPTTGLLVVLGLALLAAPSAPEERHARSALPLPLPTLSDYMQLTSSETPPTRGAVRLGRPRAASRRSRSQAAYNLGPLYAHGHRRQRRRRSRSSTRSAATRSPTTCTSSTRRSACRRCAARRA